VNHPEESMQHSEHGESLKSRTLRTVIHYGDWSASGSGCIFPTQETQSHENANARAGMNRVPLGTPVVNATAIIIISELLCSVLG
jgi:hypothetical protein